MGWQVDPYSGREYYAPDYYSPQQQGNSGPSSTEVAVARTGQIAGALAGKYIASKVGAYVAGQAAATTGTSAAVGASAVGGTAGGTAAGLGAGQAVFASEAAAVAAGYTPVATSASGGVVATSGGSTAAGVSAGTMGAVGGIVAGLYGSYLTHQTVRGMKADKGGKDLNSREWETAASPIVHMGWSKKATGVDKFLHRADPLGSWAAKGIFNKLAQPSTKSIQYHRRKRILNAGVLGYEEYDKARMAEEKANDVDAARKKLDKNFVGFIPSDKRPGQLLWINNKFHYDRKPENLLPEDIMGHDVFFEELGDAWMGGLSHKARKRIAQKALEDGQITEGKGMIDFKDKDYGEQLRQYAEELRASDPTFADPSNQEENPAVEYLADYQAKLQEQTGGTGQVDYMRFLSPEQQEAFRGHLAQIYANKAMS